MAIYWWLIIFNRFLPDWIFEVFPCILESFLLSLIEGEDLNVSVYSIDTILMIWLLFSLSYEDPETWDPVCYEPMLLLLGRKRKEKKTK